MRAICVGQSHSRALALAALARKKDRRRSGLSELVVLRPNKKFFDKFTVRSNGRIRLFRPFEETLESAWRGDVVRPAHRIAFRQADRQEPLALFSLLGGNEHTVFGILQHPQPYDFVLSESPDLAFDPAATLVFEDLLRKRLSGTMQQVFDTLDGILNTLESRLHHIESPPPPPSTAEMVETLRALGRQSKLGEVEVAPALLRFKLWRLHSRIMREFCADRGIRFIPAPPRSMDSQGLLLPEFYADPLHANKRYGELVIQQIEACLGDLANSASRELAHSGSG